MDTRNIRYFLSLCEEQSFTWAAKPCGVSQPSLSAAIKSLERELGGSVFRRRIKRTTMSRLGIAVRSHLQQIDHFAEKAKLQIAPRSAARSISAVKTRWPECCLLELWQFTNRGWCQRRSKAKQLVTLLTCAPLKGLWTSKPYRMATSRANTEKKKRLRDNQPTAA
jgi:hypothetical protein